MKEMISAAASGKLSVPGYTNTGASSIEATEVRAKLATLREESMKRIDDIYADAMNFAKNPFPDAEFDDVAWLVNDMYLRPPMPSNMPYPIKDIIRQCLLQNPRMRPTATELKESLLYVMKYLNHFTNGNGNIIAKDARSKHLWRDTSHPTLEMFGIPEKDSSSSSS